MEIKTRILTPKLRAELKKPFGILVKSIEKLKEQLGEKKTPKLIAVGDVTTKSMMQIGLILDICVVDHRVMRKPIKPVLMKMEQTLYTSNPPGVITKEAWLAIEKGVTSNKKTRIEVEGEEDLLVIPAVLTAPENSIVAYGQPNQGIVLVKVTKQKKLECQKILEAMEESTKS